MKRFLTLIAFVFLAFALFAQEHLTFKNIPIDGDIKNFTQEMIKAGFKVNANNSSDSSTWFKGEFMGKESDILVSHTPKGLVFKVIVLHEYTSWRNLSSAFDDATELYTQKYGMPKSKYQFFSSPYYKGDGYELQALRNDKCHYFFIWEVTNGALSVRLQYLLGNYYLTMVYEDAINQAIRDNEKEKAAYDDI